MWPREPFLKTTPLLEYLESVECVHSYKHSINLES